LICAQRAARSGHASPHPPGGKIQQRRAGQIRKRRTGDAMCVPRSAFALVEFVCLGLDYFFLAAFLATFLAAFFVAILPILPID